MSANQQRWAEAAPKIAMALTEAGYPSRYDEVVFHIGGWQENVVTFLTTTPPYEVAVKACEICGVGDLADALVPKALP